MSDFSKDGFHKASDASANIHVTKYMANETEQNLRNLRAALAAQDLPTPQP
jgi:hypothetical protein